MSALTIYSTEDDFRTANKRKTVLQELEKGDFHFKEYPNSSYSPKILMSKNFDSPRSNYIYYASKYYFITNKNLMQNGMIEYECDIDILETSWEILKNKSALIARQENVYSPYFIDELLPCLATKQVQTISFDPFVQDYKYYVTVNGGVY